MIRVVQPAVPIIFSSLTPGPARWAEAGRRWETNRLIQDYITTQPDLRFINLWDAMLTPEGRSRTDLWMADGIHSSHAGYQIRA
jgi:lysophospholipase L1-like esterase